MILNEKQLERIKAFVAENPNVALIDIDAHFGGLILDGMTESDFDAQCAGVTGILLKSGDRYSVR